MATDQEKQEKIKTGQEMIRWKPGPPTPLPWSGDLFRDQAGNYNPLNLEGAPMEPATAPRQKATATAAPAPATPKAGLTPGDQRHIGAIPLPLNSITPGTSADGRIIPVNKNLQNRFGEAVITNRDMPELAGEKFTDAQLTTGKVEQKPKGKQALPAQKGGFVNVPGTNQKQFQQPSPLPGSLASMQGKGAVGGRGQLMTAMPADTETEQLINERKAATDKYFQDRWGLNMSLLRRKLLQSQIEQYKAHADYYNTRGAMPAADKWGGYFHQAAMKGALDPVTGETNLEVYYQNLNKLEGMHASRTKILDQIKAAKTKGTTDEKIKADLKEYGLEPQEYGF